MTDTNAVIKFSDLDLPDAVLRAVQAVGYETPTPIQSRTIPPLVEGRDLLGHAPTGTGKTAAFALPILARMDMNATGVQALVLAPTRELAIQVAEAFAKYATHMKNLRVLPIYGGQDYTGQIRQLKRGVNVVVGTPGRIMDHMRRGTLKLDNLKTLVLDEADEMLRMGFIDDVEWILEQTPDTRQMALFSATMPSVIRRIAAKHLTDPVEINVEKTTANAAAIRQRFWVVSGLHKLDALTRILEAETFDGMLVFVRTRTATTEIADKLTARGFAASAMNGDMPQKQREQMVNKLKKGQLDILVATDVVARGLDVDRISHVINYDIPSDTESYVHRIGRTGRAGRTGDAILFVTQRERRLLGTIERATRQKIEPLQLPTIEMVNNKRIADFKQSISDNLATGELGYLQRLIEEFSRDHDIPAERVAAALARMYLGDQPLILNEKNNNSDRKPRKERDDRRPAAGERPERSKPDTHKAQIREDRPQSDTSAAPAAAQVEAVQAIDKRPDSKPATPNTGKSAKPEINTEASDNSRAARRRAADEAAMEMENFRVEVGQEHGVKAENLTGAIANEAGLDAAFIGRIEIHDSYSTVELPSGMPKFLLKDLKRIWVCERQLNMSKVSDGTVGASDGSAPAAKRKTLGGGHKPPKKAAGGRDGAKSDTPKAEVVRKKERHRDRKSKGKAK